MAVRILGHSGAHVKNNRCTSRHLTAGQQALKRHFHVPGDQAPPIKLAGNQPSHQGLQGGIHTLINSIDSAITLEVCWGSFSALCKTLARGGLFNPE